MKAEIKSWSEGFEITLKPETIKEFADLLQLGRNANSEKPHIYTSFEDDPHCYIFLHKRKKLVQHNWVPDR